MGRKKRKKAVLSVLHQALLPLQFPIRPTPVNRGSGKKEVRPLKVIYVVLLLTWLKTAILLAPHLFQTDRLAPVRLLLPPGACTCLHTFTAMGG